MPVLTLCLTTVGSFAVLFLSAKLIGHKQIAQLDFFDYITESPSALSPPRWPPSWRSPGNP